MPNLIGTAPNQVPTNGSLGNMAFQSKEAVSVDTLVTTALTVTGTGALTVGGTQIVKDASGNVGIGTSSPISNLDVTGSSGITTTSSGNTGRMVSAAGGVYIGSTTNADVIFQINQAEKARIDSSGNLLVGTTTVAGVASNTAIVTNGGIKTASGPISVATATATTVFSITAGNRGRYEVMAMLPNSGDAAQYTAIATVIWDGSTGRIVANNGTKMTLTLSGSDVQVTQTSGSTQTLYWSVQRIAL